MKKDDSIYHVFNGLSELLKSRPANAATEGGTPPAHSQEAAKPSDEGELFMDAMQDVKKVDHKKQRVRRKAAALAPFAALPLGNDHNMDQTLREDYAFNVVNLPEYMEGYVDGISPLVIEKLRQGQFSVQRVLDLHGLSAHDACDAFQDFLQDAVREGMRCVKVIHGRGLKSRKGPVLKEKLKEWIVRAMHRKWVVAFSSSKMSDGGPGATTILLRTRAAKKKLHIIG